MPSISCANFTICTFISKRLLPTASRYLAGRAAPSLGHFCIVHEEWRLTCPKGQVIVWGHVRDRETRNTLLLSDSNHAEYAAWKLISIYLCVRLAFSTARCFLFATGCCILGP